MTGVQLPTPPTDRPHETDHASLADDRAAQPAPSSSARTRSFLPAVIVVLGVVAAVLGVVLSMTASGHAELGAENERLAAEIERLASENERLGAANDELSAELRGWEEELYGYDGFETGDPVALFAGGPDEELTIEGGGRYTFEAAEGALLELAADGEGFFFLELVADDGRYVGFAELGSYPEEGFWGPGPQGPAWFVLDRDGTYELTVHAEGGSGPERAASVLSAHLHASPDGRERVVNVSEDYPTEGELPVHTFEGRAGQLAIITMTSGRPEALDPFVRLYGPDGMLIGQDDDGAGYPDARLVVRLLDDGFHEVEADILDAGFGRRTSRATPYTLTVELAELT
jgi:hypothetical protein